MLVSVYVYVCTRYVCVCMRMFVYVCVYVHTGASIPLRQWWFPPCFRFPPVSEKFSNSVENFPNFTSSRKIFWFSSAKISDDLFLVINHKFRISPSIIPISIHFPLFHKNVTFPLLSKFPLCFRQIYVFFTHFTCFSFPPTFTMMHHTMHVLDAPAYREIFSKKALCRCKWRNSCAEDKVSIDNELPSVLLRT